MTKIELPDAMMQFSDEELESQRMLMWHCFSMYITPSIQSVVEFAKRVPGTLIECLLRRDDIWFYHEKSQFWSEKRAWGS